MQRYRNYCPHSKLEIDKMAGIYIHVPFCRKKCLYCDFYAIGSNDTTQQYHLLIEKELNLRKEFIPDKKIDTIYFGGGTPSLLSAFQIDYILNCITKIFNVSADAEITIEVNPDDVTYDLIKEYRKTGVNRLSIGVQSFIDNELLFLGRRHNSETAVNSIMISKEIGFENISIDLIYGIPNSTLKSWEYSLKKSISLDIKHLSCYHLTYEEGTPLTRKLNRKIFSEVEETISVEQFTLLQNLSEINGFIHYEVSNLAKEGYYSKHNTSYWKGIPYLGLGPAAHSYNKIQRTWNPHSYQKWEQGIESYNPNIGKEELDEISLFNEVLLTHLRTIWGINLDELKKTFSPLLVKQFINSSKKLIEHKLLRIEKNKVFIPSEHFFISDGIIEKLFLVDE